MIPTDTVAGTDVDATVGTELEAAKRWLDAGAERTLVALVRHGEAENPDGIRYGRLPGFSLSPRGRIQAGVAGALLSPLAPRVRGVVTSPLLRTRETAAIVADHLGAEVFADDRLIEAISRFDGLPRRRIAHVRHLLAVWNPLKPSWAEPFRVVAARAREAILAAEAGARGNAVVLVGHQSPLWLGVLSLEAGRPGIAAALLRIAPPWLRRPRRPAPGSVILLRFERGILAGPAVAMRRP